MTDINPDDYPEMPDQYPFDHVAVLETQQGRTVAFDYVSKVGMTTEQKEDRHKILDLRCKFYKLSASPLDAKVLAIYEFMQDAENDDANKVYLPMAFVFNTSLSAHAAIIEEELEMFKKCVLDHVKGLKNIASLEAKNAFVDDKIVDAQGRDVTSKALKVMDDAYQIHCLRKNYSQGRVATLMKLSASDPRKNIDTVRRYEKIADELIRRAVEGSFPYNENREWALLNT